ncbi:SET domain-containing protein [Bradyrhizobium prioriisuperbiae]|uniref:SET domain-containing protein n=1 Tax=Bradyrhizobium prioriisuperbiae TaxID=2854389 RepID=UPI0028E70E6F|nr:SET domain-containing protein [Bradyrhizobium prioritasuperba]
MPAISSRKPYRIGRSRTGLGLFATKPIKKGDEIIEYFGPILDSRNKKHDEIENKYLFELNGRWTIDGSVRRNIARYINHACRPNAESDVQPRNRKVFIRAIKKIEPGEEINYDYGREYFKEFLKPIGCKCDACEKKRKLARAEERAAKQAAKKRAETRAAKKAMNGHALNGHALNGKALNTKALKGKAIRVTAKAAAKRKAPAAASPKRSSKAGSGARL